MDLQQLFSQFNSCKVMIIGDVMIDAYLWGKVERISPEAPVPVVSVTKKEQRLGGAANVALNIASLGAKPILCAIVGDDDNAKIFSQLISNQHIDGQGIVATKNRPTTVKTRVIGHHQHVLRIDEEQDNPINTNDTVALINKINQIIDNESISVIIFEDYDKGVITKTLIENVVAKAKSKNIPTVVDPKKRNFMDYKGVTLFKPNLKELREGLKVEVEADDMAQVQHATQSLKDKLSIENVMVTLSEHGVYMNAASQHHIPAHIRDIADVSGAGDTVVSVASLALACKADIRTVAALSNLAGGLVCEKIGVVPINKEELLAEAERSLN